MKIDERIINRFNELISKDKEINKMFASNRYLNYLELVIQWHSSSLHILAKSFGKNSDQYERFKELFTKLPNGDSGFIYYKECLSILKAAKDDYENGYLFDTRALIEAEVFDDFLEQAEHLLNQGYFTAAAVIAGSVLEDSLRKLCTKHGIALPAKPKLDTMNADLAKAGVYNLLKQKQITALADLRNKAAHGKGGFTKEDVEDMIRNVRRFMEDYFS